MSPPLLYGSVISSGFGVAKTSHNASPRRNTAARVGSGQSKRKLAPSGASVKWTGSAPGKGGGALAAEGRATERGAPRGGRVVGRGFFSVSPEPPAAGSTSSGGGTMASGAAFAEDAAFAV